MGVVKTGGPFCYRDDESRPIGDQNYDRANAQPASPLPFSLPVRVRVRPGLSPGALRLRGEGDELDVEDQRGIGGDDAARTW